MGFSAYVARKLSLSSNGRKNSPAVGVAIAAVAISIGVMLAAVAIVLGFKKEIRNKVVGFNGHITLYIVPASEENDNILTLTPSLRNEIEKAGFITDYSLQAAIPAILKTEEDFKGIYLKGLQGKTTSDFIFSNLEEGEPLNLNDTINRNKIYISRIAANQLKLQSGDKIDTYFMSDDVRVRRLEIAGIFNSHFDQYDDVTAFGSLNLIQHLGGLSETQGTYLQLTTNDFDHIHEYSGLLQQQLNEAVATGELFRVYRTDNVLNQGAGFFSWLELLDTNVVVILTLMTIVACMTLISGMMIIILDKKRFIGLMKSMGASTRSIRQIFIFLSLKITLWGILIGNILMLCLLSIQEKTHFLPMDPDSYYIDFVPVKFDWWWIGFLNLGILVVVYLTLVLPSRFVAGISPAESVRYE